MTKLAQGRRPVARTTRPLLLAGTGIAVLKVAAGCLVSGNLVALPHCDGGTDEDPYCQNPPDSGTTADGGSDGGADGGEDAGLDGGDDGGTADAGP
jgi:heme A synthase